MDRIGSALRIAAVRLSCAVVFLPLACCAVGVNLFEPVPTEQRSRLIQRLELFMNHQRQAAWEAQFELLSPLWREQVRHRTKEDYVKSQLARDGVAVAKILDFVPIQVGHGKPYTLQQIAGPFGVLVFGCATAQLNGVPVKIEADLHAWYVHGDWYFSEVNLVVPIDGQPLPCKEP